MKLILRQQTWKLVGLLVVDGVVFSLTNAGSVPSFMLVVGFLLLAMTGYYLIHGLLSFVRVYGLSVKRKRRLAAILTAVAGGLTALQSIGELNGRDVVVLLPLVAIGYAYSVYSRAGVRVPDV
jgi:hypothetical protein